MSLRKISSNNGFFHKKAVEEMRKKLTGYDTDHEKEKRLKKHLCKYCFYVNIDLVGMSAMTRATCTECNKDMMFPSSVVDYLCPECAEELNLCKHCRQEMD